MPFSIRDNLLVILPENHRCADSERFPVAELVNDPFILLEKGGKAEISEIFERNNMTPNVRFTTWNNHAVLGVISHML